MLFKATLSILFLLQGALVSAKHHPVLKLNDATFWEKTEGKAIFIKFFAPWCEHCQDLAPEFAKLAEEWEGHENGMIVEMDCEESDSLETCYHDPFNVEEYPTLWYGDPRNPKRYHGEWNYAAMSAWAIEHIGMPPCSVKRTEFCNDYEKQAIHELQSKTKAELEHAERQMNKRLSMAQAEHDAVIAEVNTIYENVQNDPKLADNPADFKEVQEELNSIYENVTKELQEKFDFIRAEANHNWLLQVVHERSHGGKGH